MVDITPTDDDNRPSTQDVNTTVASLAPPMIPMTQQAPAPLPANFLPIPTSLPPGRTALPPPPLNPLADVETPKDLGEVDTKTAEAKQQRALTSLDLNNLGRPQQQIRLPEQGSYPMTPESTARHALSAFSNPLMWLAIAGSALTKNHAMAAMTAATGVLEGARANDMELQKLHAQKFKGSVAEAKAQNERELADYNTILESKSIPDAEKPTMLYNMAAAHRDDNMQRFLTNCPPDKALACAHEAVEGRKKMGGGLDKASEKQSELALKHKYAMEEIEARNKGKEGAAAAKSQPAGRYLTDEAVARVGDEWVKGNKEPARMITPGKQGAADRSAVLNYIAANHPDADLGKAQQEFHAQGRVTDIAKTAEPKALAHSLQQLTDSDNALGAFERTAEGNLRKLNELAQKVDITGVPAIERWVRAGRQATGDPDVAAFNTQWALTVPEVARIMTQPRLVGQLTDAARHEAAEGLPASASVKQLQKSTEVLFSDFARRRESYQAQRSVVQKKLTPDAFPEPSAKDREWGKKGPDYQTRFMIRFGVEP